MKKINLLFTYSVEKTFSGTISNASKIRNAIAKELEDMAFRDGLELDKYDDIETTYTGVFSVPQQLSASEINEHFEDLLKPLLENIAEDAGVLSEAHINVLYHTDIEGKPVKFSM